MGRNRAVDEHGHLSADKGRNEESAIIAKIKASAINFDISEDTLLVLKNVGVSDAVLAAMVNAVSGVDCAARRVAEVAQGSTASALQPKAIPGIKFRDRLSSPDSEGPEMVVIPAGRFWMGCLSPDNDCKRGEKPVHEVVIAQPFALSVYEVTFEDYDRFTYPYPIDDEGWGRGSRPVMMVSWNEEKYYVVWLSMETGSEYRLPSEAEWEYAARARITMNYSWGEEIGTNLANCFGCKSQWDNRQTAPVG